MVDAALSVATFAATYLGFAFLALLQRPHWRAVVAHVPGTALPATPPRADLLARALGSLAAGFCSSLLAQGPGFGSLFWVLTAASMSVAVTFPLTWRAPWLGLLLRVGVPRRRSA
jgi:hypothetical protein